MVYTIEEVAKKLQITENTLRRLLRNKKIKGLKVGKEWRIKEIDLDEFLGNK